MCFMRLKYCITNCSILKTKSYLNHYIVLNTCKKLTKRLIKSFFKLLKLENFKLSINCQETVLVNCNYL